MITIPSNLISRHSPRGRTLWKLEAENISPWCRLPGSPFFHGFYLVPNHPSGPKVLVKFGRLDVGSDLDAFSYLISCPGKPMHRNTLDVDVGILDAGYTFFNHSRLCLTCGEMKPLTLALEPGASHNVFLTFSVSFRDFVDTTSYGFIEFRSIVGHKWNSLTDLFNHMRSDKGTEWGAGAGTPHCYTVEYYTLFQGLQEEEFNFLEIGLDNASKESRSPKDAPSLRAWRQFFGKATLYGYDINDFSFFNQERTITFQGDQASREDLRRFRYECDEPQFRVILDDGSHASSHQQVSLATLWPSVEPGGMYLIEDLGWQPFVEAPKTIDVLHRFVETSTFESPFATEEETRYLEATISRVEIYKPNDSEFAVIYKKE